MPFVIVVGMKGSKEWGARWVKPRLHVPQCWFLGLGPRASRDEGESPGGHFYHLLWWPPQAGQELLSLQPQAHPRPGLRVCANRRFSGVRLPSQLTLGQGTIVLKAQYLTLPRSWAQTRPVLRPGPLAAVHI